MQMELTVQIWSLFPILSALVESQIAWSKNGNEGKPAGVQSIIYSKAFITCLNFMLFKLFMRIWLSFELFFNAEMGLATCEAS